MGGFARRAKPGQRAMLSDDSMFGGPAGTPFVRGQGAIDISDESLFGLEGKGLNVAENRLPYPLITRTDMQRRGLNKPPKGYALIHTPEGSPPPDAPKIH